MTIKDLENYFDEANKEEDVGCPYFFDEDCGAKVTEAIYNNYC